MYTPLPNGFQRAFLTGVTVVSNPVPEPSAAVLMGVGAIAGLFGLAVRVIARRAA
jgi:hypothetical protein